MLVEFRVKNYRSFRDETVLSLVAASERDQSHPDNLIRQEKFDLLKTAAIYGANASGKSNLIKALGTMQVFVLNSATSMNVEDKIPGIVPFRLDVHSQKTPTTFEVTGIREDGQRFEYGFSATADRVYDEWLIAYPHGTPACWLERRYDQKTDATEWDFRPPLKKSEGTLLRKRTRANGLALSKGAQENLQYLEPIYRWFKDSLWILDVSQHEALKVHTIHRIHKDPKLQAEVVDLVRQADFGIDDIKTSESAVPAAEVMQKSFRAVFSPEMLERFGHGVAMRTFHRMDDGESFEAFDFFTDESLGTQRFLAVAGPVLDALKRGVTLVVDELECSMHPLLTRKVVELFHNPEVNRGQAQLVFAAHDTSLMDPGLLRRDQVLFVEKKQGGESELFSLFDIKERPRHDTAFERNYLAGRYGAVPSFGPIFENLELR